MRKTISLATLSVLVISVIAISAHQSLKPEIWNRIPVDEKFRLKAHGITGDWGDLKLEIQGFYARHNLEVITSRDTAEGVREALNKWWPNRKVFLLNVSPYGNQYFWPTEFAFVQDGTQYNINNEDLGKLSNSFHAGELKEGTVTRGFLAVPAGIDTDDSFTLWYKDDNVVID